MHWKCPPSKFYELVGIEVVVKSQAHFGRADPFTNTNFFVFIHLLKN